MALFGQSVIAILAVLLVFTVGAKLDSWPMWSGAVEAWARGRAAVLARIGIPTVEIGTVVLLLTVPRLGLLVATVTLASFAAGVLTLSISGRGGRCGCFGQLTRSMIGPGLAAFDLLLSLLAGTALIMASPRGPAPPTVPQLLLVLLAGALLVVAVEARRAQSIEKGLAMGGPS